MVKEKKGIIIGGGIGGLATAVKLQAQGIQVEVFERAPFLRETGSGFIISPNGVKAIRRLGSDILDQVISLSGDTSQYSKPYPFYNQFGNIRLEHSFNEIEKKYGAPILVIHRQNFHRILNNKIDPQNIHCHMRLIRLWQDGDGVIAQFEDGTQVKADFLIAADGLNSSIRSQLFDSRPPSYIGCTSVRGIVKAPKHPLLDDRPGLQTTGPGLQFYSMRMADGLIYWTATPNAREGEWTKYRPKEVRKRLLELFNDWHDPISEMISETDLDNLIVMDIYDRPPLTSWRNKRITLLGDAAHPMSPFMGQGANMAIEDAVCLADCLTSNADLEQAFKQYEEKRMARTYRMVAQSRLLGTMGHLENPFACWLRDLATKIAMRMPGAANKSDWIFTYEP